MKREMIKSIILAALVIISLMQTYSIWTYTGNFEPKKTGKIQNIKPINPESDVQFSDVVRPYQLIHMVNDDKMLGTDAQIVDRVYKEALSMKWKTNLGEAIPNDADSYELVFPSPLKLATIQTLFDLGENKTTLRQDWLIDRISIYQQRTQTTLAFKDVNETVKFTATSPGVIFKKGVDYDKDFKPYERVILREKHVYIPSVRVTYQKFTYPFTLIDIKEFVPILFNNTPGSYSHGAYTDGDSLLKQDDNGYVLKFINPATGGDSVLGDPIYQGFSYIDSHKGWTGNFTYDHFESTPSENQDQVDYRLTLSQNSLPVFSSVNDFPAESVISITWENGILYKLDRPLINIGNTAYSSDPSEMDYSGKDVLTFLKNDHISLNGLQDLRVGYRMEINPSSRIINFYPDWFYKTGDQWKSLDDLLAKNTPDKNGGEKE
ncbi:MAG: YycH family regulatory protein [Tuberibacillus sp.]